jgi:DNA-binding transcriptional regulator YbjK
MVFHLPDSKENIEQVLLEEDTATIDSIDAKLEELQQELIKRAGARQDYEDLADEIDNLQEQRLNAMTEKAEREDLKMRINEMQEFLENQTDRIGEYDEQLVRKMIEKITIYDDKFVIEFKSGTSLDVRR